MRHLVPRIVLSMVRAEPWHRPAIIVGTGRSLVGFDLTRLRGLGHVVAVNGAMADFPKADHWVTMDHEWIRRSHGFLSQPGPSLVIPIGSEKCIGGPYAPVVERATYVKKTFGKGRLSDDPSKIECGGTSGYSGLAVAHLHAPPAYFLFGFDYREDGGHSYCPDRYSWRKPAPKNWPTWASAFRGAAKSLAGKRVVNASRDSAIDAFDRVSIEAAVEELKSWSSSHLTS